MVYFTYLLYTILYLLLFKYGLSLFNIILYILLFYCYYYCDYYYSNHSIINNIYFLLLNTLNFHHIFKLYYNHYNS